MLFRKLFALVLLVAVVHAATVAAQTEQTDTATAAQSTRLLIGFTPEAQPADQDAALTAVGLSRGQVVDEMPQIHAIAVELAVGGPTADALIAQLGAQPLVSYAEVAVELVRPEPVIETSPEVQEVTPDGPVDLAQTFVPNDPLLAQQYGLTRMQASSAWAVTQGSSDVIIAVIDSGITPSHTDLDGKLVPGPNVTGGGNSNADRVGHGTSVAGVAAAETNNGIGIAGMCPTCRIMSISVEGADGRIANDTVARAIIAAADRGTRIINLSLGSYFDTPTMRDAVNYAWNRGAFLVCAAGNDGVNRRMFPAGYRNCFSVGATNASDARASFSNFGTWVYATAPGDAIITTSNTGSYASARGTSFSAPYVAGVAGLLSSQGLNNAQIRDRLCGTADKITGTGTNWYCGRINASRAVRETASQQPFLSVFLPVVRR
ncbi:MAG: S8 family serine peptidase [Chloroflexaceae bacterium]|nr:S8 family serine peptidase [Chloroflexaceae bacterium]